MQTTCDRCGAQRNSLGDTVITRCPKCGQALRIFGDARGLTGARHDHRGLTGARHESSVLFSLDDLAGIVARRPEPAPSVAPVARTASAPTDDRSGLIDLRHMQRLVGAPRPASRLDGLVAPAPAAPPAPAPRTRRAAETPLYMMLGALALGMLGLAAAVVTGPASASPPAPIVTTIHVPAAAPAEDAPRDDLADEPAAPEPVVEPAPAPAPTPKRPRKPDGAGKVDAPKPKPAPVVDTPKGPQRDSVECLLDPKSCRAQASAPADAPKQPAAPAVQLPEKLEPADVVAGTSAVRAAAERTCKALAKGGEKVTIKLSIAGPTGSVLQASPQDDAGNPRLAACCADELAKASFKKVQKPQIGAVVTVKF